MISKQDFASYFDEMIRLEKQMEASYRQTSELLTHPMYKRFFQKMSEEEKGHADMINGLVEILK